MNNQEKQKLAIGVVSAALLIGVLHFLLFSKNANQFKQAQQEYTEQESLFRNQGSPKSRNDIYQFDFQTIAMKRDYYQMLLDSGIAGPMVLINENLPAGQDPQIWVRQTYKIMYDQYVKTWLDRGENPGQAQLGFLINRDPSQGWGLLRELPESARAGSAVSDRLRNLKEINDLIKAAPEDSNFFYEQTARYNALLAQLGLDLNYREALRVNMGPLVAMTYTQNRINLIMEAVPRRELSIADDEAYYQLLLDLYRFEDYEMLFVSAYRQLRAVDDAIKVADKHRVQSVNYVKLWSETNLNWPTLEMRRAEAGGGAAGAVSAGGAIMGDEFADPAMFADPAFSDEFGGFDEGGRGGRGAAAGRGVGGEAAGGAAAPVDENKIGVVVPFEIRVIGTNAAIQSFLYEVSQLPRYYGVDKLSFAAIPQQADTLQAAAVINVLSYFTKELVTENQVQGVIDQLTKNKNWLASKGIEVGDYVADSANVEAPDYGSPAFVEGAF
jgi:hypothetical protein